MPAAQRLRAMPLGQAEAGLMSFRSLDCLNQVDIGHIAGVNGPAYGAISGDM
jgi:hypothetical protein